jgi:hypothetical protein
MAPTNHDSISALPPLHNVTSQVLSLNKTTTPPFTVSSPGSNTSTIQTITFGVLGLFLTVATIWISYLQLRRMHQHHLEQRRREQDDVEMQRDSK